MDTTTFEVQILSRTDGEGRWVRVQALNRESAIQKVAELGEIVGEARLLSVEQKSYSDNQAGVVNTRTSAEEFPSEKGAIIMSWLGLLIPIFAIVGWSWGYELYKKTDGKRGAHSRTVGATMTFLWLLTVPFWFMWLARFL